ncbi:AMP-binding protein [Nocardia sp. CDC159]|uniref:AMP-binding protein n=1 Tax=Nocardia pulmonis TaxID=2951408 RepID=A0A9X2J237_9NOCA|nr:MULTISPECIES: AMP-binding protein [Nocardia]MCM6778750.1 AMP-binding protein [Nocardia pulmonis]MCM6791639.1 AMP-binding protein [Nocardia sp. CDC159]
MMSMCEWIDPTEPTDPAADLTHQNLDRWSNRLARILLGLGARPGARIAIAGTPQLESDVTRLAVAKTGATVVPIDIDASAPRADLGVTTKAGRRSLTDSIQWLVLDDRSTLVHYLTGSDAPITEADRRTAYQAA